MDHREGFQNLTSVDEALKAFFGALGDRKSRLENVSLDRALGRYLGKDVVAREYMPPFDRAVMDGYATRAEDLKNASQESPAVLDVVGESKLGGVYSKRVEPGKVVAVATGSMIPVGADTVVMVERTAKLPGNKVAIHVAAAAGQSIARKGEDVSPGKVVLRRGIRIRPQDVGVLKALGATRVHLARKPRVAILSTGNELVDSVTTRRPGKSVDINRTIISAMLVEIGAVPVDLGIAKDTESTITTAMKKGLKTSDALLVSGGSSVGNRDLVPKCVNNLGKPGMLVHGVAMRPAMPTGLAVINGKPLLSLPGFPVSAFFAFRVFVRPLVAWLMGVPEAIEPKVKAILNERITAAPGHRTFIRVVVTKAEHGYVAVPLRLQRSSVLMSLVSANGIITIPEGVTTIEEGQTVDVSLVREITA